MSLTAFSANLISRILSAASQQEVKQFIETDLETLEQNKVTSHIISNFVDNIIIDLEQFSPINKNAQQWSNINMARIYCNRIKHKLTTPAH
jgi:hypothetical protein